jgi:tRNA(fMet)-specific endonuclease VapC
MILDTTFLIDLEREIVRLVPGSASEFLKAYPDAIMRISVITLGELCEGYKSGNESALMELVQPYDLVEIGKEISLRYGKISRIQRDEGTRIGDNDLWIAATALELGEPLVTRDASHFPRIPHLSILSY